MAEYEDDEITEEIPQDELIGDHRSPAEKLQEWLDLTGNNVFGTGLNYKQWVEYAMIQRIHNSYSTLYTPDERMRRRNLLLDLSVAIRELAPEGHYFGIRLAETAIDDIIAGDWESLRDLEQWLMFEGEGEVFLREAFFQPYVKIRGIIRRAYSEAPDNRGPVSFEVLPGGDDSAD